jgi:hypothetical protein
MNLPPAIIFINAEINSDIQNTLQQQLHIDEIMDGYEFDQRIIVQPDYPNIVHSFKYRILVIRKDFPDTTSHQYADLIIFVKLGQASIIKNNYGEPGLTLPISRINIYELLRYNKSEYVVILPDTSSPPKPYGLRGIVADQMCDASGVYLPNIDSESNNKDFINRK